MTVLPLVVLQVPKEHVSRYVNDELEIAVALIVTVPKTWPAPLHVRGVTVPFPGSDPAPPPRQKFSATVSVSPALKFPLRF